MLKRLNNALPGLILGIILYGVLVQFLGMWFVEDKISYSIGLWYGIAIAAGMAYNLAVVIYDSVSLADGERANRRIIAKSVFRYIIVVILFMILGFLNFGNLFMAFVGVLGLKVSAYVQPLLGKLASKFFGKENEFSNDGNNEKMNKEVTM